MKLNKKVVAGMMSAVLLAGTAMVMPVRAASTEDMNVTFTQEETYTLTIPASSKTLNLSTDYDVTGTVEVKDVNLAPGNEIQLSVTAGVNAGGVVELRQSGGSAILQSSLTLDNNTGEPVKLNTVFANLTQDGSITLKFSSLTTPDGSAVKAGDYSGRLTFSASIASAQTNP